MMYAAITGHRNNEIDDLEWIRDALRDTFKDPELGITKIIQGMARGVDLTSAQVAMEIGLPYDAARPWLTHNLKSDEQTYENVLNHAERVYNVVLTDKYQGPWVYQQRNKFMVDSADMLIAVWNGTSGGGTWSTVAYARQKRKPIYHINPVMRTRGWSK